MRDLQTNQMTYPESEPWAFWDVAAENELTWVQEEFGADGKFVNALGVDMETGYNIYDTPPAGSAEDNRSFEERLADLDAVVADTHPPLTGRILFADTGPAPRAYRQVLRIVISEEVEEERQRYREMAWAAEADQTIQDMASTGTEGRIADLIQDRRPQSELHPPGYKQAVLMARYLLGKGESNTDFHVFDENGQRETTGYIAQFYMCGDGDNGDAEAHRLFLDTLEIAPDKWPEVGSAYDGEPEIVKLVMDGAAVITRQVIRIPDVGSDAVVVSYLAQHTVPAEETLVEMGFPTEELSETEVADPAPLVVDEQES